MLTRRVLRAVMVSLLVGLVLLPQSPALAGQPVDPATRLNLSRPCAGHCQVGDLAWAVSAFYPGAVWHLVH